jgi:hypothetical protein
MVKSFKYFQISPDDSDEKYLHTVNSQNIYKYSLYMQSKDSTWIKRNIDSRHTDGDIEPIENDIRGWQVLNK